MKSIIAIAALITLAAPAVADTCAASATAMKLAGAARTSFMTRCERDAQQTCDTQATARHLAGAAKTSFVGKCVKDAVGTAN